MFLSFERSFHSELCRLWILKMQKGPLFSRVFYHSRSFFRSNLLGPGGPHAGHGLWAPNQIHHWRSNWDQHSLRALVKIQDSWDSSFHQSLATHPFLWLANPNPDFMSCSLHSLSPWRSSQWVWKNGPTGQSWFSLSTWPQPRAKSMVFHGLPQFSDKLNCLWHCNISNLGLCGTLPGHSMPEPGFAPQKSPQKARLLLWTWVAGLASAKIDLRLERLGLMLLDLSILC